MPAPAVSPRPRPRWRSRRRSRRRPVSQPPIPCAPRPPRSPVRRSRPASAASAAVFLSPPVHMHRAARRRTRWPATATAQHRPCRRRRWRSRRSAHASPDPCTSGDAPRAPSPRAGAAPSMRAAPVSARPRAFADKWARQHRRRRCRPTPRPVRRRACRATGSPPPERHPHRAGRARCHGRTFRCRRCPRLSGRSCAALRAPARRGRSASGRRRAPPCPARGNARPCRDVPTPAPGLPHRTAPP